MADPLASPGYGPLEYLDAVRDLLAASSTFQDWVGAADADSAKNSIYDYGPDPARSWSASAAYDAGDVVEPAAAVEADGQAYNLVYECTTAGTTGSSEPSWSGADSVGETLTDGTVTWTARRLYGSADQTAVRLARPFAAVALAPGELTFRDEGYKMPMVNGDILMLIEADVPDAYAPTTGDASRWFLKKLSQVVNEIADLGNTQSYLGYESCGLDDAFRATPEEANDAGDHFVAVLSFTISGAL